jgi:hypothetical protein
MEDCRIEKDSALRISINRTHRESVAKKNWLFSSMLSGADVIGLLNESAAGVPKGRKPSGEVVIWAVYVLSSYEADVVKPLIKFFVQGLADPAGASQSEKSQGVE